MSVTAAPLLVISIDEMHPEYVSRADEHPEDSVPALR
jgi:hypothetical protein